jgi:DNA-binding HxlR family transcriptional regulator
VAATLALVGDRWTLLIVRDLLGGTKRFGELQRSLDGISHKVLAEHLRHMEETGFVVRRAYAEVPPHVEYSLTEIGRSLSPIIDELWKWGEAYKSRLGDAAREITVSGLS